MQMAAQFFNGPRLARFNRDQFMQMVDLGFFDGKRVQLIGGEIVEMPPQGNKH